ncbi:MAG: ROK family protein [Candidatus Aminicenantaceae bacterium]
MKEFDFKTTREKKYCGAVDVGGTKISSALLTSNAEILCKNKIPIDKSKPENAVYQIIEIINNLTDYVRDKSGDIMAVGIAIPGVVFHNTGLVWAPNIPGWDNFPLIEKIKKEIDLPLVMDSDRSAYVLGEHWCGIAKDMKNVVFLAVGTGIGAGIIIDGKIFRGAEDISGAVGWFALTPEFREEFAEIGCFEAEASGNSVARRAIKMVKEGESSIMEEMVRGNIEEISAEVVVEAAKKRDPLASKVIDMTTKYLAMGIANIVSILNPEVVILGGGLFQAGKLLLNPVRVEFKKWAQPLAAKKVRIELSALGDDAGLFGAGKLAWDTC